MFGHVWTCLDKLDMSGHFWTCLDVFWQKFSFSLFLYLDMFGHVFDRTKYTLHSTKYKLHRTKNTLHSAGLQGFRCAIQELGSSGDVEFMEWEFRRWGVQEKKSSADGEFRRWRVHEMESSGV